MKKLISVAPFIAAGILFAAGAAVLLWWGSSCNAWIIRSQLQRISPLFLEIAFGLLIIAAVLTIKHFKKVFSGISRKVWIVLLIVVASGLLMDIFVVPREHRVFYDEDIYENIAQNIAFLNKSGMCNEGVNKYGTYQCLLLEYNKQPNAWPYLLSVVFRLFGVHETAAFLANNMIYALSIVTAFLIGFLLFESVVPGLYAALIFALIPEGLMWSNTTAVEPGTVLFSGLTVLSTLLFVRTRDNTALFLVVVLSVFTVQFRTESAIVMAVPALIILLSCPQEFARGRFWFFLAVFFVLLLPHLIHLYAVRGESWGASGPKLSLRYFAENFRVNSLFYIKNVRFPAFFTLLFGLGVLCNPGPAKQAEALSTRLRRTAAWLCAQTFHWQSKTVVIVWFLVTWGIFLFFYAGSYNFGIDVRYSLVSHMPLSILAGYGAGTLGQWLRLRFKLQQGHAILCALILFSFCSFLPFIRAIGEEAWAARADHRYAREMAELLPDNSIVLTHNPNMFLVWGKSAAQASLVTERPAYFRHFFNRYSGGVYFHYNFWCNVSDPLQNSFCSNILERFACTQLASYTERDYTFGLYKIEKK